MQIRIYGLREMERAFEKAPVEVRRAMRRAMQRSVNLVKNKARVLTPVRTGKLRRSIKVRIAQSTLATQGTVGPEGSDVHYGRFQEFGTKRGVPETRFMGTAGKVSKKRVESEFRRELFGALDRLR